MTMISRIANSGRCRPLFGRSISVISFVATTIGGFEGAKAQTCFRTCLSGRLTQDITDEMIRYQMTLCRNLCEDKSRDKLVRLGLDRKIDACEQVPLSDAEFKSVRAASASFLTYANSFTWDVHNVLKGKVIRKVEIAYPTLDLDETTATGGGIVFPGEVSTILINGVFEGYPAMRYGLRIKAVYACPLD
jgi:hypothetical protein